MTTWEEFPGDLSTAKSASGLISKILLSRAGIVSAGGNIEDAAKEAEVMRGIVRRSSSRFLNVEEKKDVN